MPLTNALTFRKKNKPVDFTKCSKLTLFTGTMGLNIKGEFRLDYDGDTLLLASIYNDKNIGILHLNKEDKKLLKEYLTFEK